MALPPSSKARTGRVLIRDQAADDIQKLIFDGVLKPGDTLCINEISNYLGCSRTPIREAYLSLAGRGLLEIASNSSTRVRDPAALDLQEAIQALKLYAATPCHPPTPGHLSRDMPLSAYDALQEVLDDCANSARNSLIRETWTLHNVRLRFLTGVLLRQDKKLLEAIEILWQSRREGDVLSSDTALENLVRQLAGSIIHSV